MRFSTAAGLAASVAGAQAVFQGFNYGATKTDSSAMEYQDYVDRFHRAQNLTDGKTGFTSARLYTMIQSGTTSDISQAFQAAIDTKTSLLLGVWCSAGQETVSNEISALSAAIEQLGDDFTSLVAGISVGSEDLYRITPTGIENDAGIGAGPDDIVNYIQQVKKAISGTALSGTSIGHVDTWTAWVNGSNSAVIDNVDWLGMDTYPYFQTTVANSIDNGNKTFWDAYDVTDSAGNGKEVWITETGWPVSGDESGQAVASVQNAETYWQEVGCALFGKYNTWWYTLEDSIPTTPSPSFGIIGQDVVNGPLLYDIKCKPQPVKQSSSSKSSETSTKTAGGQATGTVNGGNHATQTGSVSQETGNVVTGGASATAPSASASASGTTESTGGASQASSAVGAGILAIFALVASL